VTDTADVGTVTAAGDLPGPRPQPLGALPWPAGMLVLPAVEGADAVAAALVRGEEPATWPDDLAFVRTALGGDADGAAAQVAGDDAVAAYNRAVLVGGDGVWDALLATGGELRALVGTARFSLGLDDTPPTADGTTGEVRAVVRSARASAALEVGDPQGAVAELGLAAADAASAASPLLAATLRATRAELLRERLDRPAEAAQEAARALTDLPMTTPAELRAELMVTRALSRQAVAGTDRGALLAVVADLQEALRTFREETHPEAFAACNQHLALAYLVMPMTDDGDRIRLGVAVSSLRAALRVYTPQSHPLAWASTQLNLANALQYLPSVHQEQNLDEAVQLYEELLAHRDPGRDPVGVARILANQGNALGHLGVFSDARERLGRARALFDSAGDDEGVAGVDEILTSLAAAEAAAQGGA
jgi:tetratricopeptide (TPR) repeat protein